MYKNYMVMKKNYQQPALCIVAVEPHAHILQASVQTLSTNLSGGDEIHYAGAGNGDARVKGNSVEWDDWEE